jgi:RNA polymerase sigma-70 factor (ECF subfamily)
MSHPVFSTRNRGGGMPTTRWTLVRAAGAEATVRRAALEEFARDYWPAVYAFIRRRGHAPADAEDLTQGFLVDLIGRESLAGVTENGVRFRSWLLAGDAPAHGLLPEEIRHR